MLGIVLTLGLLIGTVINLARTHCRCVVTAYSRSNLAYSCSPYGQTLLQL